MHKVLDPRTPRLIEIAEEEGLRGPHLRLFEAIGRTHEQVLGRRLPLNGAGVCGAALADLGLPVELLRGFALLARAAGLLGQIAEEERRPIGMDAYLTVDRNAVYVDPTDHRRTRSSMATVAAVIASTHHPFYYRASTATGDERPPFADEWQAKIETFRETLTRAEPDVLVMVGSDHFHQLWLDNMPQFLVGKAPYYDANWYNEEREFHLPRMTLKGDEDLSRHILRNGLDMDFDLAFSNELRIDHSITCPIITLRPQADLPIVPIYTNIFAPPLPQPKRFVAAGQGDPRDGRVVAVGPAGGDHRHRSPVAGARRAASVRRARPRSGLRPQGRGVDRQRRPRGVSVGEVTLDSLHPPGNATHGFMDFMLMMGVAGEGVKADHADSLDLFHTMEAYFTWYPEGAAAVSKYLLDKFLFTVDRDPELVERYREDPAGTVAWWEAELAQPILNCHSVERSTWLAFSDEERDVLVRQDHVALFELGAHPFLTLTLFIAMFERDHGPLEYQIAYGQALQHLSLPYPDIAT